MSVFELGGEREEAQRDEKIGPKSPKFGVCTGNAPSDFDSAQNPCFCLAMGPTRGILVVELIQIIPLIFKSLGLSAHQTDIGGVWQ